MEVCGTHTHNFRRFALHKLLPANLKLIAGPGCPVCVSQAHFINQAIELAGKKEVIILTFGDMLRIPGERLNTLEKSRARSCDIRVVYSPLESLTIAGNNPDKKIVFLAVGFETTAPAIGATILLAQKKKLRNLFFYTALKLIPPAMDFLARDKRIKLDGFLCPGHVSAVIGSSAYDFIAKKYRLACCVAGFEPVDILEAILMLLKQRMDLRACVENQYFRVVEAGGNLQAKRLISKVFQVSSAAWRSLGEIAQSGLEIRSRFSHFDAKVAFGLCEKKNSQRNLSSQCRCGMVLKGIFSPPECPLFMRRCTPDNPIGPCMVSQEGACNAYFKYQ